MDACPTIKNCAKRRPLRAVFSLVGFLCKNRLHAKCVCEGLAHQRGQIHTVIGLLPQILQGSLLLFAQHVGIFAGITGQGDDANLLTDEEKATLQSVWQQAHDGVDLHTLTK